MKRLIATVCLILLTGTAIFAQNENDQNKPNQEYEFYYNNPGDKNIKISIALDFPLNFPDFNALFNKNKKLGIGGAICLGYNYFLTKSVSVGGQIGFGYNPTIGEHTYNYVPFLACVNYTPAYKRMEFPLSLKVGVAWETYSNHNYFPGLVINPSAGVAYKITDGWSVGIDFEYMALPQFSWGNEVENFCGQFVNIVASARYYF